MPEIVSRNGRITPLDKATVSVDDWSLRYGWGLFETIRIAHGCPLFLDQHLERMCATAPLLGIGSSLKKDVRAWTKDVENAVKQSRMREGVLNCYWTHGSRPAGRGATRIVRIRRLPIYPDRPLKLWLAPWRIEPTYPGSGVKTLAYFPNIFAAISARRENCEEALILNTSECVADGASSSIFVMKRGRLVTPSLDQGTLPGVTRGEVLRIAKTLRIPARESRVPWKAVTEADDIFTSSSLRGLRQVSEIRGHWKRRRVDNSIFMQLSEAWTESVAINISRWSS